MMDGTICRFRRFLPLVSFNFNCSTAQERQSICDKGIDFWERLLRTTLTTTPWPIGVTELVRLGIAKKPMHECTGHSLTHEREDCGHKEQKWKDQTGEVHHIRIDRSIFHNGLRRSP